MSVSTFGDLLSHAGHSIVCVTYGDPPCNVAVECETCNVVIIDFDNEEDDPPGNWIDKE